jgi:YD repeat-containing protein
MIWRRNERPLSSAIGNLLTLPSTTTNGVDIAYQYDALNRLTDVIDNRLTSGNKNTAYGFDGVGNLQAINYRPNGVTNLYRYDALNRLTNMVWNSGATMRAGFTYTLGAVGNRLTLAETNSGTSRTFTWGYDNAYRLTSEAVSGGSPTGTLSYGYDDVANRTSRSGSLGGLGSQTLYYDTNDRIDNDTNPNNGTTYFDANGNTVSLGGTWAYDWANRLTNFNSGTLTNAYDAAGNRLKRFAGGTTTHYLVATVNPTGYPQVVEEHTGTSPGTLSRRYTYGLDLISQTRWTGSAWDTHFFLTDGLV